jgi:glutathione S-transferase
VITVHHLENSRSQRILWLLEELGVEYEIKHYKRDSETMLAPPALQKLHALGKSPIVTDDGLTFAESGAIVEYLVDKYDDGGFRPATGTSAGYAYTYWLHYAEGTFAPLMMISLIVGRIESAPLPFFLKPVTKGIATKLRAGYLDPNINRNLDFMESNLSRSLWFCGDELTAADIQMSFAIEAAAVRSDLSKFPNIAGFIERMHARPAYQRGIEKGGPFQLMGAAKP